MAIAIFRAKYNVARNDFQDDMTCKMPVSTEDKL